MIKLKFSIILPIYNVEKYLPKCVESILSQTFTDYEIILVDDGSTDNSPAICDKFAKEHSNIKVIHKENGGQSEARNLGADTANGEYIIFIDSDDFIIKNDFLEKINKKTQNNADLIFYKYQKYFDDTRTFENCRFDYKDAMEKSTYSQKIKSLVENDSFYGMAWIKAIKKETITKSNIQFDVNLVCEDMDWNYDLIFHSGNIEFIDESFIAYRQRANSVTTSLKIKNLKDFVYILEKWSENVSKIKDEEFKTALYGSLAKYYSNLLVIYNRVKESDKKKYKKRIKNLSWLLKYSMSKRPKTVAKIYKIFGFDFTVLGLKILDRIK